MLVGEKSLAMVTVFSAFGVVCRASVRGY